MNPEKHLQDVVCDRGGDNGRWSRDGSPQPQPRLSRRYYPWWGPWLSLSPASNGLGAEIKQSQVSLVLQWQWRGLWLHKTYLKEENNHWLCCCVACVLFRLWESESEQYRCNCRAVLVLLIVTRIFHWKSLFIMLRLKKVRDNFSQWEVQLRNTIMFPGSMSELLKFNPVCLIYRTKSRDKSQNWILRLLLDFGLKDLHLICSLATHLNQQRAYSSL